jgi:hypothetical protein
MNPLTKRAIHNVESTEPQRDLLLSVCCGVVLAVLSVAFFL